MSLERTSPILFFILGIWVVFKNMVLCCLGQPRRLLNLCYRILDFDCQETSDYVRHVTLRELFKSADVDNVTIYSPLDRGAASMTFDEIVHLCSIVRILVPKVIFEIGTFRGYTIRALIRHAPATCKAYTLDLPPEEYGKSSIRQHSADWTNVQINKDYKPNIGDIYLNDPVALNRVTQLLGSSDTFDFTPFEGKVDLFIIDGAHSYDFVLNDTEKALRCLTKNGIIIWHDLKGGFRGLVQFFRQFGKENELYHLTGTSLVMHRPKGISSLYDRNQFSKNDQKMIDL